MVNFGKITGVSSKAFRRTDTNHYVWKRIIIIKKSVLLTQFLVYKHKCLKSNHETLP